MIRCSAHTRAFLLLLCIAMLVMRVGGAHLHLCFDGTEPRAVIHLDDGSLESEHEKNASSHSDFKLSLSGEALAKKAGTGFDLPALLIVCTLLFLLPRWNTPKIPRQRATAALFQNAFLLRPPLRGPPL